MKYKIDHTSSIYNLKRQKDLRREVFELEA